MIEDDLIAGHQVNFVYVTPDGKNDKQFTARCHFLPRIGDHLIIDDDKKVVVGSIYHKVVMHETEAILVPNVVLRD